MAELKRGELLKGRYRIERVIGQGAMGAVYAARDESLPNATWAIKILSEDDVAPEEVDEAVSLFRREAEICARLRHPGLPEIVDFFEENRCHVLVMERIHGETLDEFVERHHRPMTETELLPLLVQLAACLHYLHTQQPHPVVFRDLKPSNCMITAHSKLKLIDFGIARYYKAGRKSDTIVLGTPGFCAPEQYGAAQTDARSDIYSLGATAWHLLTGRDPAELNFALPPLRQIVPTCSEALERIVATCVCFEPEGRYPSSEELLADLKWAMAQVQPPTARRQTPWQSSAASRTNRLARSANQHLTPPVVAAASGASTFGAVRPAGSGRHVLARIDADFMRGWARRTFRVWWGPGSVYPARIVALLFLITILNTVAHFRLESIGPAEYNRSLDQCTSNLETIHDTLEAFRVKFGHYPVTLRDVMIVPGSTETHPGTYSYTVTPDRRNYIVYCKGHHDGIPAGYPRLSSHDGLQMREGP